MEIAVQPMHKQVTLGFLQANSESDRTKWTSEVDRVTLHGYGYGSCSESAPYGLRQLGKWRLCLGRAAGPAQNSDTDSSVLTPICFVTRSRGHFPDCANTPSHLGDCALAAQCSVAMQLNGCCSCCPGEITRYSRTCPSLSALTEGADTSLAVAPAAVSSYACMQDPAATDDAAVARVQAALRGVARVCLPRWYYRWKSNRAFVRTRRALAVQTGRRGRCTPI